MRKNCVYNNHRNRTGNNRNKNNNNTNNNNNKRNNYSNNPQSMTNFMVKSGEAVKDVSPKRIAHTKGEAAVVVAANVNKTFNTFSTRTRERERESGGGGSGRESRLCVCLIV